LIKEITIFDIDYHCYFGGNNTPYFESKTK